LTLFSYQEKDFVMSLPKRVSRLPFAFYE